MIATNKIEPIPTSALKNWSNIRDTFTKPSAKWLGPKAQIVGQIWTDDKQTDLWMVPTVYNYDFDRLPPGPRLGRGGQHLDRDFR